MEFISKYREHIVCMEPASKDKKGRRIEFHNGRYQTTDKKEIEFLRKHREFGVSITEAPEISITEVPEAPKTES